MKGIMKETKQLLIKITPEFHKELKLESVKRNMSMKDLIINIMGHWLKEQEKYR
jgi:hypothetical protein